VADHGTLLTMSHPNDYARPQGENFEVVLVKKGVNPLHAKSDEFKRVPVHANDPTSAVNSDVVTAAAGEGEGFVVVMAAKPMVMSDYEHQARLRDNADRPMDRTKI
jgi:hypothetical protein